MRFKNKVFLLSLLVAWIASTTCLAQVPTMYEVSETVTEKEVRQFIAEYKTRFARMELDSFMALFSKDAIENRVLPYQDIKEAYRKVIAISQSISCNFKIYLIKTYNQSALVSGHYEAVQLLANNVFARVFDGDIQWVLVREDGVLKIKEVNYGKNR